jgi:hypothetical protein
MPRPEAELRVYGPGPTPIPRQKISDSKVSPPRGY